MNLFNGLDTLIFSNISDGHTQVYAAWTREDRSTFKLGYTRSLVERIHSLKLGNQDMRLWFHINGSPVLESLLKSRFWNQSIDGREIFQYSRDTETYFKRLVHVRDGTMYR